MRFGNTAKKLLAAVSVFFTVLLLAIYIRAATLNVYASNTIRYTNSSSFTINTANTWQKGLVLKTTENITGTIRVLYTLSSPSWGCFGTCVQGEVRQNGVLVGSIAVQNDGVSNIISQDLSITLTTADTLEVWAYGDNEGYPGYPSTTVSNFKIEYDYTPTCAPPGSGDWTIAAATNCVCSSTWSVPANTYIYGNLTMNSGCSIRFTSSNQFIYAYPSGNIFISAGAGFDT